MQGSNDGDLRSKAPLSLQQPLLAALLCCLYKLTRKLHDTYYLKQGFLPKLPIFLLVGFCAEAAAGRFLCGSALL